MILITGASGMLGGALTKELQTTPEPVEVLPKNFDLRSRSETLHLLSKLRPRVIYHAAAKVMGIMGNARYPADIFTENVQINSNIIEGAIKSGCEKFVGIGTVAVYGASGPQCRREEQIWGHPPHGYEAYYGHAKRAMLAQLEACNIQYGLKYAFPIVTNLYGPNDRFDAENGHVIPSLIVKFHKAAKMNEPVSVWGTGAAERDFLFVEDAARAIRRIGEMSEGAINVAAGETVSLRYVAELLADMAGTDIKWDTDKPEGELFRRYDVSRLRALNFKPAVSLPEGLRRTYEWYCVNINKVRY